MKANPEHLTPHADTTGEGAPPQTDDQAREWARALLQRSELACPEALEKRSTVPWQKAADLVARLRDEDAAERAAGQVLAAACDQEDPDTEVQPQTEPLNESSSYTKFPPEPNSRPAEAPVERARDRKRIPRVKVVTVAIAHELISAVGRAPVPQQADLWRRSTPLWKEILGNLAVVIEDLTGKPAGQINADNDFREDLGVDSLTAVEIGMHMEDIYQVRVPDHRLNELRTVGSAVDCIYALCRRAVDTHTVSSCAETLTAQHDSYSRSVGRSEPSPFATPAVLDEMMLALSNMALSYIDAANDQLLNPQSIDLEERRFDRFLCEPQRSHDIDFDCRPSQRGNLRRLLLHDAILVGEESEEATWSAAMQAPKGTIVVYSDPADTNADVLDNGFSTNLLAYIKTANGFQLVLSMVVSPSRHTVAWQLGDHVSVRSNRGPFKQINELLSAPTQTSYVACVAEKEGWPAATTDLPRCESDDDTSPDVVTVATDAAAATVGLVLGRCSALVSMSPKPIHDMAAVPAMLALNLPVYDANGLADRAALMERFNHFDSLKSGGNDVPLPPLAVGRDPEFVSWVADNAFRVGPKKPSLRSHRDPAVG